MVNWLNWIAPTSLMFEDTTTVSLRKISKASATSMDAMVHSIPVTRLYVIPYLGTIFYNNCCIWSIIIIMKGGGGCYKTPYLKNVGSAGPGNESPWVYFCSLCMTPPGVNVTFPPAAVKSRVLASLWRHEKPLKSCTYYKNVIILCNNNNYYYYYYMRA